MFGLGPAYLFVLQQRLPVGTNVAIAGIVATLIWCVGIRPFLLVHLPIILTTCAAGFLFIGYHEPSATIPSFVAWAGSH
jgi:omega-6 fatty acid desaturase (delta-12 desaturase)